MIYEKSRKIILDRDMLDLLDRLYEKFEDEPDELVVFMKIILDKEKRHQYKKSWNYDYLLRFPEFKKFVKAEQDRDRVKRCLDKKKEREE